MLSKILITLSLVLSVATSIYFLLPTCAQSPPQNEAAMIMSLRARVTALEESAANNNAAAVAYRLDELERKMAGVQKQVTVLHAKKADKAELQETRDQTANVIRMIRSRLQTK